MYKPIAHAAHTITTETAVTVSKADDDANDRLIDGLKTAIVTGLK